MWHIIMIIRTPHFVSSKLISAKYGFPLQSPSVVQRAVSLGNAYLKNKNKNNKNKKNKNKNKKKNIDLFSSRS